jgi:hypothetical protein
MLEVRKNTYSKNYENTFFREFARHLHKSFADNGRSGLLIGSPFCEVDERLQIDALLITDQVVSIIDFKNFSGKINLPNERNFEMGIWTNETGDQIKGGSSINPFIQLKNQKRRFSEVYTKSIKSNLAHGDTLDCSHIVCAVCFQKEIELNREIPNSKELAFWIIDRINFIEKISDIIDVSDKDVNISPNSYHAFKKVFRADKFKFYDRPLEDKLKVFADKSTTLDFKKLYADQHSALSEIKAFLENPEQQIFVLQGTANSGKSYLIPFIQELAYNLGIQETEIFASSSRVANNLLTIGGLERVNSIYSYIYGGQKNNKQEDEQTKEIENNEEIDETNDSEELQVEEIPLKNCDNADNALFIVDESQLVSDSFNQSIDLIFGTGYLLKDFLSFTNSANTKRKIIFIGDPFQLQLGKTDESPLNPLYLEEAYKLKTNAYQLLDKPDFSNNNKEALFCVDKIRTKYFNSLQFIADDNFCFLQKEDVAKAVSDIIHNKIECHILCFSNEESQNVNYWIKQSIIKNGQDIAINDLVLFNNNISIEDINDPFAEPKKVYNGQFATITGVNIALIEKIIKTKKNQESTVLTFREISLILNETGQKAIVLSLENYRLNAKAELSKNEIVAFKILLNSYIADYLKSNPFDKTNEYSEILKSENYMLIEAAIKDLKQKLESGEKVKTKLDEKLREQKKLFKSASKKHRANIESTLRKDPSTEYYKFKNSALLRFGWAMTIDKASSYKWKEVIINTDSNTRFNGSKTHEPYFRLLYTAISRATRKVSLINYKPISPFDKTEFVDNIGEKKAMEFLFISDNTDLESAKNELIELVKNKLGNEFVLNVIEIPGWNVRVNFIINSNEVTLDFGFDKKAQFKFPKYISGDKNLSDKINELVSNEKGNVSFDIILDLWRKTEYLKLNNELSKVGFQFNQIIQTQFKDRIKVIGNNEELDLEVDYNGDGAFSKITAKYYSNQAIWNTFIDAINQIKA